MEFNYNDGGRSESGYKGKAGDCACRAIAIATGIPYQDSYDLINRYGAKERMTRKVRVKGRTHARTGVWMHTMRKIMKDLGWEWVGTMGIGTGCKVHMKKDELPSGRIICRLSGHYSAVIDGVVNDTYDPSREETRCVYGYWINKTTK